MKGRGIEHDRKRERIRVTMGERKTGRRGERPGMRERREE